MMFERAPHREIQDIINLPTDPEPKPIKYQVGEKVLIKNRELPSTTEGIPKKLLLLYVGP